MTNTSTQTTKQAHAFQGVVVSRSGKKTVRVRVRRTLVHPKYGKQYVQTRSFLVHDEKETSMPGDEVSFVECRPLSRTKRWRIDALIRKNVSVE